MSSPNIKTDLDSLPAEIQARHEALVDFFGRHLFWCRRQTSDFTQSAVSSPDLRKRLGRIPAESYARVAELPQNARDAAIDIANAAVDDFMKRVLVLFTTMSADQRLGEEHGIRYKLYMEIIERADWDRVVTEELINRDGEKVFCDYFGRWLLRHREMPD